MKHPFFLLFAVLLFYQFSNAQESATFELDSTKTIIFVKPNFADSATIDLLPTSITIELIQPPDSSRFFEFTEVRAYKRSGRGKNIILVGFNAEAPGYIIGYFISVSPTGWFLPDVFSAKEGKHVIGPAMQWGNSHEFWASGGVSLKLRVSQARSKN